MARSKRKGSDKSDEEANKSTAKKRRQQGNGDVLVDTSVFGELATKAGIILKAKNKPNEITQDKAVFQRNLTLALKRHPQYPEVLDEFVDGLVNHIEDIVRFRWSLMPSIVPVDSDACSRGGTLDSMMRLFLGVDILQPKVMEKLLEKLAELSGEEDAMFDDIEKVNLPKLIMDQFRWLDRIVKSQEFVDKMFEILTVTSRDIQQEIIICIPEVTEDSQHPEVAKQLRDLLLENNELAVPILDALSNMSLRSELLAEVRDSVLQTLESVSVEDLPVIVKFLLQTLTAEDSHEVMKELRAKLDFQSCIIPKRSATDKKKRRSGGPEKGVEALTVDAITSAVRFQRFVSEAWIKAIDNVKSSSDHKPLDLIVLLILHSNNHKKPVESLVRNKIRGGKFTEVLLQSTFTAHSLVLREFFPSVLSLAEVLLRSPEPVITYFACAMYKHGFQAFDTYCQQEIVGNLVIHVGSGFEGEVDASLDILLDLGNTCLEKMIPFIIFVKGILDYMDNLSVCQIRKLYALLSLLAFRNPQEEGMIQDELHILIRKQLTHDSTKYQRMGVIGAIMVIQSMAANKGSEDPSLDISSEEKSITDERYKQALNLLELVRTSCSHSSEGNALFMDELATIIQSGKLDPKVEGWIAENVINDFQDEFVVDIDPQAMEGTAVLPWKQLYGLDDESEGPIAINLLPMVADCYINRAQTNSGKDSSRKCAPLYLASNFRLLQICEARQHEGDLDTIDALLGCPLYLTPPEIITKVNSLSNKEKEILCESTFLTINWFIECINAFGCQEHAEMKGKVITRLQHITELQKSLEIILAVTSDYIPPPTTFDLDTVKPPAFKAPMAISGKKGRKPAGKSKKKEKDKENVKDDSDDSRDSTILDRVDESQTLDKTTLENTQANKEIAKASVDIMAYSHYFREIDLSVFNMLRVGLITKAALDTEMNTKDTTVLQIQPPQLEFLLKDLVRKTEHALIASASKRRTFLKVRSDKNIGFGHLDQFTPASVAQQLVKLLPALCGHLEGTSAFFQALLAANDGVLDGPGCDTDEAQLMGSCFHLSVQTLLNIFSWNGFLMSEHRGTQKEAFVALASRLSTSAVSQMSLQDLIKHSFQYLENFSVTVPVLATGVTLCKLLVVVGEMSESNQIRAKIGNLCGSLLKREWFAKEGERAKGAKHNEHLQTLLKMYLDYTDDVLTCLESLAAVAVPELLEAEKDGCSKTFPSLTRNSYPVFYRVMLSELVKLVKSFPSKSSPTEQANLQKLYQWNIAVRIFHILVNLVKTFDARANLNAVLKYGRQFLDIVLRQGMPLLDNLFRKHREDVQSLLKNVQLSTRALQHLCGHSKIVRDITLTNQVPLLKKVLEVFVYRVKAMLTVNKCIEAFWLGNLKNRDLHGEEILSQSTTVADATQDSDNDVPEEEEESDVEMDNRSETTTKDIDSKESDDESYSETF